MSAANRVRWFAAGVAVSLALWAAIAAAFALIAFALGWRP